MAKVYVGNIAFELETRDVEDAFARLKAAEAAIQHMDGCDLHGRRIKVAFASSSSTTDSGVDSSGAAATGGESERRGASRGSEDAPASPSLFVANIPPHIKMRELEEYFEQFGRVRNVKVLPQAHVHQGMSAFIDFVEVAAARRAHEFGMEIDGYKLRSDYNSRPQREPVDRDDSDATRVGGGYSSSAGDRGRGYHDDSAREAGYRGGGDRELGAGGGGRDRGGNYGGSRQGPPAPLADGRRAYADRAQRHEDEPKRYHDDSASSSRRERSRSRDRSPERRGSAGLNERRASVRDRERSPPPRSSRGGGNDVRGRERGRDEYRSPPRDHGRAYRHSPQPPPYQQQTLRRSPPRYSDDSYVQGGRGTQRSL
ncbi:hypothetical protein PybrP1_010954 [[Pythium] brassicae (nom. inval.)]|nr:hypothetical protein PybrP1_010954 [[Pythium] brassicae (nom. inval.)]